MAVSACAEVGDGLVASGGEPAGVAPGELVGRLDGISDGLEPLLGELEAASDGAMTGVALADPPGVAEVVPDTQPAATRTAAADSVAMARSEVRRTSMTPRR